MIDAATAKVSACRMYSGFCGTLIEMDKQGHAVRLHGDREHPISKGYICPKGVGVVDDLRSPDRILRPLRRRADGTFEEVSVEVALDEIASRLRVILDEKGPDAVGCFNGTYHYSNVPLYQFLQDWLVAIGSPNKYTTNTIDQSCHG